MPVTSITGLKMHQGRFNRLADDMREKVDTNKFNSALISLYLSATSKESKAEIMAIMALISGANNLFKILGATDKEKEEQVKEIVKQTLQDIKKDVQTAVPMNELQNIQQAFASVLKPKEENESGV